jgi:cytochrome c peroxidase
VSKLKYIEITSIHLILLFIPVLNFCTLFNIKLHLLFISAICLFSACSGNPQNEEDKLDNELLSIIKSKAPNGSQTDFILPESFQFEYIPQDPKNPITKEKVALGGFLFHETALGIDAKDEKSHKTYSCASCHHAAAGFQSGSLQGIGDGGQGFGLRGELRKPLAAMENVDVQPLKTPSAMNGAYQPNQMWNGQFGSSHLNKNTTALWIEGSLAFYNKLGYEGLETKAIAGMTLHRLNLDEEILKTGAYKLLFDAAFPELSSEDRYTKITAGLAIAAYERTLLSNEAPFQKYLKGNSNALSEIEKHGAKLFFGKAGCVSCHTGPALNSNQFNALGFSDLVDNIETTYKTKQNDPVNLGRGSFTKDPFDNYKFKVPQLYNLTDSPFFGHGASLRSIRDVIVYKNNAIHQNKNVSKSNLDPLFKPLNLTNDEINYLEAFISRSLYDPNLKRYVPQHLPSGLCFPNADVQSRKDMDCF